MPRDFVGAYVVLGTVFQNSSLFRSYKSDVEYEFKSKLSDRELNQDDLDWFLSTDNFKIVISSYSVHYLLENRWKDETKKYREVLLVGHLINSDPMPVCRIFFRDYLDLEEIVQSSGEAEFAKIGLMDIGFDNRFPCAKENVFFSAVKFKAQLSVFDVGPEFSKSIVESIMNHLDNSVEEPIILSLGTKNSDFKESPFEYESGNLKVINKMAVVTCNSLKGGYSEISKRFEKQDPDEPPKSVFSRLNQPTKWIFLVLVLYFVVSVIRGLVGSF